MVEAALLGVPGISDALVVVILLVPGFIAMKLFARITAFDRKLSDFDITVYSLMLSLIIYLPFTLFTGLSTLDRIREAILFPSTLGWLLLLSIVMGIGPGFVVKLMFRRGFFVGNVWQGIIGRIPKNVYPIFVLVDTVDGKEILGQLHSVGTGDQPKDVLLFEPKLIIRNKTLIVEKRLDLGKELFIPEKDVRRVIFL